MPVLLIHFRVFLILVIYNQVCDSLSHRSIYAGFMKQICDLAHWSESVLGIILPSVQQQPDGVVWSVFAVAFAVDILNGFAEIGKRFDVGTMRTHLLKCLEEEEFTLFPRSHKHTQLSKGRIFYVDIYCICRSLFYEEDSERGENLFMAECVKCGDQCHKICLRILSRVFKN